MLHNMMCQTHIHCSNLRNSRPARSFSACFGWRFWRAGVAALIHYDYTPGSAGLTPATWPAASHISRAAGQATLVVVAHPKCPCTRATLQELAALMAERRGAVTARVLFFKPAGAPDDWAHTDSWRTAAAIPGVTVSCDEAGAEAQRFGGETSGDTFLYDATGRLTFHGGITAARGMAGENAGHTALADLLAGQRTPQSRTPVFGCPVTALDTTCPPHP